MNFRLKNFLITFIDSSLFFLFLRIGRFEPIVAYGMIAVGMTMFYFLVLWLLNFEVYPLGFITIIFPPTLWFGISSLIYINYIVEFIWAGQAFYFLVNGVFLYYFLSTQSILNLSYFKNISLSQAAFTSKNFYTILLFFNGLVAIFLVSGMSTITKMLLVIPLFLLVLIPYVILYGVKFKFALYSSLFFFWIVFQLLLMYVFDLFLAERVILVCIVLGFVFKGITILLSYSQKKLFSLYDGMQLLIEAILCFAILYFMSDVRV